MVEIFGPESPGKTTLIYHVIAEAQKARRRVSVHRRLARDGPAVRAEHRREHRRTARVAAGVRRAGARDRGHVRDVDHDALELIADQVDANIRALEGAVIRVVAFGSLTGRPVTATLANEVLTDLYPELKPRTRSVKEIQEQTRAASDITMDELVSSSRAQPVAFARQVAMYLARELTDVSLPAIGRAFGDATIRPS
jgi:chromosomal replication initiation ATPase DnaA